MDYFQKQGQVTKHEQLTETVHDIWVHLPEIAKSALPGQFVNILVPGFFLRRPISICETEGEQLRLVFEVRGQGTAALAEVRAGENIDILGALGKCGFGTDKYSSAILVGGGIGTPPLKFCKNSLKKTAAVLGFRDKAHVIMENEFDNVTVCTDDGSYGYHGNVTVPLENLLKTGGYDVIMACGPKPMLKAVTELSKIYNIPCEASLEERMACGVGACLGCACKTVKDGKEQYTHVCKDGPVFSGEAVDFS
jgi:dihydroorotate dehydrogenase electron transfer subunit